MTANLDIALPTSFEKSSIRFDGYDLTFYDVGGDVSMRNQWKSYYAEVRIANYKVWHTVITFLVGTRNNLCAGHCKRVQIC